MDFRTESNFSYLILSCGLYKNEQKNDLSRRAAEKSFLLHAFSKLIVSRGSI